MSDLDDLYQQVIVDHSRRPRNFRVIDAATTHADGHNPLCGDRVTVFVLLDGDTVSDVSFQGTGCAISMASASMLTETLRGKTKQQAERLFQLFHQVATGEIEVSTVEDELGKLAIFQGVREFPSRVKCATLVWHTLQAAFRVDVTALGAPVSTEG